jgi:hypothetical protein
VKPSTKLSSLLAELRAIDRRCKGFVTFYHKSSTGSWAECSVCKHKWFEDDLEYKVALDGAKTTGKVQQCVQERAETIPARVRLLERIVETLCLGIPDESTTLAVRKRLREATRE